MALKCLSKASAMHCVNVRLMVKPKDAYIFTFHKLYKSCRKGEVPPKLYFNKYWKDQELCSAVSVLDEHLKRTKTWRTNGDEFHLFLSYIKLHVEGRNWAVSRWIKEILKEIGVDVGFKGHSTRSASTSKACLSGISVDNIFNRRS